MEVLKKWLDPADMLVRACWKCGEAVAASAGLACAEDSAVVPLVPLKIVDFVRSVKLVAWAEANGCPWVARVCSLALQGGCMEALQWGCTAARGSSPVCALALPVAGTWRSCHGFGRTTACGMRMSRTSKRTAGHSPLRAGTWRWLQWAREHDCPWDYWTCCLRRCERAHVGVAVGEGARVPRVNPIHGCVGRGG